MEPEVWAAPAARTSEALVQQCSLRWSRAEGEISEYRQECLYHRGANRIQIGAGTLITPLV